MKMPKSFREWITVIIVTGSVIYAIGFLLFLIFYWENPTMRPQHPLGFQVNGENL
jgi:hypothetical protein